MFSEKFSAHLEGRSDGRAKRFQTLSDTSFSLNTKNYVRTVTFFSGESNSHQMVACTRKLHFWQLRPNICAKSVEILIQNLAIDEKKLKLFEQVFNILLWRQKMQFCQQCRKEVSSSQTVFRSESKLIETFLFSRKMSLHPKWYSVQIKCSSDSCTETSPSKVRQIFCLKTQIDKETVKLYIGNTIFQIMVACAGKVHFWQLRWKLLAISMTILFSKLEVCEK